MGRYLVDRLALDGFTPRTLAMADALQGELTRTRARGYAVSSEERLSGVNSVAATIPGRPPAELPCILP